MKNSTYASSNTTVLWAGAAACALSVVVTIAMQGALHDALAQAYTYTADRTLASAQSATLTYLFTIAGAGLMIYTAYALLDKRRARQSVLARWLAVAIVVIAGAIAVYNMTQPFPLALRLVGLLPPVIGLLAVRGLMVARRTSATA